MRTALLLGLLAIASALHGGVPIWGMETCSGGSLFNPDHSCSSYGEIIPFWLIICTGIFTIWLDLKEHSK